MRILYGKGRSALRRLEDVWNEEFSTENGQKSWLQTNAGLNILKTKAHQERDGEQSENETKSE
jgi:hypothetical protein